MAKGPQERWKGLMDKKASNAREAGVPNATVKLPSRADVDAFNKRRKERVKGCEHSHRRLPSAWCYLTPPRCGTRGVRGVAWRT